VRPPSAAQPPYSGPAQTVARLFPIAVAKLVVVKGVKNNVEYPIYEGTNYIGRFDELPVDIDVTDQEEAENPWCSRQHACISFDNGALHIEDLGSSNGTFVNRVRLTPNEKTQLKNGDYIQTGKVMFQIKC
jgi:pSer/pThr/pTyr-binding forkhead associated (FHA) protein